MIRRTILSTGPLTASNSLLVRRSFTSPASAYNYSDGDASIAGAAVAAAAGTDLLSYANQVLFTPLGFKNVEWWFQDKAGRYRGGWGLRCEPSTWPDLVDSSAERYVGRTDHHRR